MRWDRAPEPPLPPPQTELVVEAVRKDQEGDASAALALYCKALEYFVPALRCECPGGLRGGRGGRSRGGLQSKEGGCGRGWSSPGLGAGAVPLVLGTPRPSGTSEPFSAPR